MLYYTQVRIVKAEDDLFNESDLINKIKQVAQDIGTFGKLEGYSKNKQKIDQLKNYCNNPDFNLQEIQKIALELLQLVIKFDFEDFFDLNRKVDKSAELITGKDIILLLGSTGSGKSTTIHYLCGSKMEIIEDKTGIMHI